MVAPLRPRWHDVTIVLAIVALALAGVWALYGDDLFGARTKAPAPAPPPAAPGA